MSQRCYVATRKGLFTVDRGNTARGSSAWAISRAGFCGITARLSCTTRAATL